jgi:hypothetical protein
MGKCWNAGDSRTKAQVHLRHERDKLRVSTITARELNSEQCGFSRPIGARIHSRDLPIWSACPTSPCRALLDADPLHLAVPRNLLPHSGAELLLIQLLAVGVGVAL